MALTQIVNDRTYKLVLPPSEHQKDDPDELVGFSIAVPDHETLRREVEAGMPTEDVRAAALRVLECAAAVRAAKDYQAEVEHPLQQRLFLWHQEAVAAYRTAAIALEEDIHSRATQLLAKDSDSSAGLPPHCDRSTTAGIVQELLQTCMGAVHRIMIHASDLRRLRLIEKYCTAVSSKLSQLSAAHTRAALALDKELFSYMQGEEEREREDGGAGSNDDTRSRSERQGQKENETVARKRLLEAAAKKFATIHRVERLSYRPYDPDAPFAPNLLLSRPLARAVVPSAVVTDVCCACEEVIGDYGKPAPRAHCLDCDNGFNAVCGSCFRISTAVAGCLHLMGTFLAKERRSTASAADNGAGNVTAAVATTALLAILEGLSPHVSHHSSGLVDHAAAFIFNHVAMRYATVQAVVDQTFLYHRDRPLMGIMSSDGSAREDDDGEDASVTLGAHLGYHYRRWAKVPGLPYPVVDGMKIDEEAPSVDQATTHNNNNCNRSGADPIVATDPRLPILPVTVPTEMWRQPSPDIQRRASAYEYAPLTTRWITYRELDGFTACVANIARLHTTASGSRMGISVDDSPLWYALEVGVVRARRCAVGAYALWEGSDIADAMELAKVELLFVDAGTMRKLLSDTRSSLTLRRGAFPQKIVVLVSNASQQCDMQNRVAAWFATEEEGTATESSVSGQRRRARSANEFVVCVMVKALSEPEIIETVAPTWFMPDPANDGDHGQENLSGDGVPSTSSADHSAGQQEEEWEKHFLATKATPIEPGDEKIAAVCVFTSGTSGGRPKGVTTTCRQWHLENVLQFYGICDNSISAYAPCWATDKHHFWRALFRGGRISFHNKAHSLFECLASASVTPTLSLVPFLSHQLPSMVESVTATELDKLHNETKQLLASSTLDAAAAHRVERSLRARARAVAVYHLVEHVLGGRLFILSIGGAAVRPDVLQFLKASTPCLIMENYGLTECGGVLRDNKPFPGSLVKLVDRPELGYTTSDKPFPRGEFAVKNADTAELSEWVCDEPTREVLKSRYLPDGYFLTGDIGLQRPDGSYEVIDRASAVRKLANGKFFSPERVEQTIMDFVGEHSNNNNNNVTAIVSDDDVKLLRRVVSCFVAADETDHATIRALFLLLSTDVSSDGSVSCAAIRKRLRHLVQAACVQRGIPRDEIPTECFVEDPTFDWTTESGCLTASRKPNRKALSQRLTARLEKSQGDDSGDGGGISTTSAAPDAAAAEDFRQIHSQIDVARELYYGIVPCADAILARPPTEETLQSNLPALGCDSLALSRVARLIGPLVQRMRRQLALSTPPHPNSTGEAGGTLRDISMLPAHTWLVPSLMRCSPMTLAELLWVPAATADRPQQGSEAEGGRVGTHGVRDGDSADALVAEQQPFFTRQLSAAFTTASASGMERRDDDDDNAAMARQLSEEGVVLTREVADDRSAQDVNDDDNPRTHPKGAGASSAVMTASDSADPSSSTTTPRTVLERIQEIEVDASASIQRYAKPWALLTSPPKATATPRGYEGSEPSKSTTHVLLTGAAGFFGSAILEALLDADWVRHVTCLVRSSAKHRASERVWLALCRCCTSPDRRAELRDRFDLKVNVVDGDLEKPLFGLGSEAYTATFLSSRIDLVVHVAAVVKSWNMEAGLEALRGPNVDGTVRLCQLSIEASALRSDYSVVPILFVSTVSVCKSHEVVAADGQLSWTMLSELSDAGRGYYDAYSGTKLMAENAVREWAQLTSAPLRIFRAPLLTWHSRSGAGNEDDWLCRLLDAVLTTRLAPRSSVLNEGTVYSPVDVAARSLLDVAQDLLRAEANLTLENSFRIVRLPEESKINIMSVLGVVVEESQALVRHETKEEVPHEQRSAALMTSRAVMDEVLWVPVYAWRAALDNIALTHPTAYHPLLEKGILELQRAAGVRPIHPVGVEAAHYDKEIGFPDREDLRSDDWVRPLRAYLKEYFLHHP